MQEGGLLSDMLVLAGFEGYHVVERSSFHRSQYSQDWPVCLISRDWPKKTKKMHQQGYFAGVHPTVDDRP